MTPPSLLLCLTVALWGALADHPVVAIVLISLIEGMRLVPGRWAFAAREYERVTDLVTIGFAAFIAWQWSMAPSLGDALISTLSWLPALLCPLIVMQRAGTHGSFPRSALFWSYRRDPDAGRDHPRVALDYPYFLHCLLAMACANPDTDWFLGALIVLCGYALWPLGCTARFRPRWLAAFASASMLAIGFQAALLALHDHMESELLDYFRRRVSSAGQGERSRTAMGDIDRLNRSRRILFRVEGVVTRPFRLRDGVYDSFLGDTWFALKPGFRRAEPDEASGWILKHGPATVQATVAGWLPRGAGVLPMPEGTVRLDGLNVGRVEFNRYGVVRVGQGPDLIRYRALTRPASAIQARPDPSDLRVPVGALPVLDVVITEAGLRPMHARAVTVAVERFFKMHFAYGESRTTSTEGHSDLETFLTKGRAGHCEYFATSTVLLLRRLGIPARYVTGYLVDEWSEREGAYLVRGSHAHAWTIAWIDGAWVDVDTTPAIEFDPEGAVASRRWLADGLSWLHYRFALWRLDETRRSDPASWLLLLVLPMAGYVIHGILRRSRRRALPAPAEPGIQIVALGELGRLVKLLEADGKPRPTAMPLRTWIRQLPLREVELRSRLRHLADLYANWRFDPDGSDSSIADRVQAESRALAQAVGSRPTSSDPHGSQPGKRGPGNDPPRQRSNGRR